MVSIEKGFVADGFSRQLSKPQVTSYLDSLGPSGLGGVRHVYPWVRMCVFVCLVRV